MTNEYYVYVYIDPRNFEEFYYGKRKESRKNAHLAADSDSEKSKRIRAIKEEGLEPIIRVIASGLSQHDALLVEKTLLWKLGKQLTNISSGHYAENFRPHDTLHLELSGFDFQSGLYYYNVGECETRNWDDYLKYNFISAGGNERWRDGINSFKVGDVFVAYLKSYGYVGVGEILQAACPVRDFKIDEKPLLNMDLACPNMGNSHLDDVQCEHVCSVKWHKTFDRVNAKWKPKSGLYTTTHIRASLDKQQPTIEYINTEFQLNLKEIVR